MNWERAEMAENLSEIIRLTREATIEECAKEVERGYFLSDMIRCADTLDDCGVRIRALVGGLTRD